jgi:hypothetical protein
LVALVLGCTGAPPATETDGGCPAPVTVTCDAQSCAGCCKEGVCLAGIHNLACGYAGIACATCNAAQECSQAQCKMCPNLAGRFRGSVKVTAANASAACPTVGSEGLDDRTFVAGVQTDSYNEPPAFFTCTTSQLGCDVTVDCGFTAGDGTGRTVWTLTASPDAPYLLTGTGVQTGTGAYCPSATWALVGSRQ